MRKELKNDCQFQSTASVQVLTSRLKKQNYDSLHFALRDTSVSIMCKKISLISLNATMNLLLLVVDSVSDQ